MPDEEFISVVERACQAVGYETKRESRKSPGDDPSAFPDSLIVAVPNGRFIRWNTIRTIDMEAVASEGVRLVSALGDYEAIQYQDSRDIEVALRPLSSPTSPMMIRRRIERVVRALEPDFSSQDSSSDWKIKLDGPDRNWSAEISESSKQFNLFCSPRMGLTLKIQGATSSTRHDEALELLNQVGQAILFEFDLRYGIAIGMARMPLYARYRRVSRDGKPSTRLTPTSRVTSTDQPTLPRNSYPENPLSLYWYARSATGMPLLQYLASYQVLEYYFTTYYQRETMDRIKQEFLDPRFNPQNDTDLNRIIGIATSQGKAFGTEREQLKATVRACIASTTLTEYIRDDSRRDFFTGNQAISGVPKLDLSERASDIRDQVSDRIYDIRCRIVHAKPEAQDRRPDLILPFSTEADALIFDIDLVQYLAQRVLISRAKPLRLP